MPEFKPEDVVRDELRNILELDNPPNKHSGVGQLFTFKNLGFKGKEITSLKPDGWFLPHDVNEVAIICETKNSNHSITKDVTQLEKYIDAVLKKYKNVIGILYNGYDILVYKNKELIKTKNQLFSKDYYIKMFNQNLIDKNLIYTLTKRINDNLHFQVGIKNLNHRMIFTACSLVAKRYGAQFTKGTEWSLLHMSILNTIKKSYQTAKRQNEKLDLIAESFIQIQCNYVEDQDAIDDFIECVDAISDNINSDFWRGEDVMGIFFNEFTRYKGKTEQGQVFTPDHITSFMYKLIRVSHKENVLDACCGSGAFLIKALSNMINEVGGATNEKECRIIKSERLYGIELDKELFSLACANMLIHKDGKTNIIQDDSRKTSVGSWIKEKNITRVLMNPPYERKYGGIEIVENVLDSVMPKSLCAFILPDNKLEVYRKKVEKWLKNHSLLQIIKLPDIFAGMASNATSIFVFETGVPHENKEIFTCWMKEDGLETVKNQGRHDIKNKWKDIEDEWLKIVYKKSGSDTIKWISPNESLAYKEEFPVFTLESKDLNKFVLRYLLYKQKVDEKFFYENALDYILYGKEDSYIDENVRDFLKESKSNTSLSLNGWKEFSIAELFEIDRPIARSSSNYTEGSTPFVASGNYNNGVELLVNPKNEVLDKGNCISFSPVDCSAFYQKDDFLGRGGGGSSVLFLRNTSISEFSAMFVCVVLNKHLSIRYDYNNMCSAKKLLKEKILLPVTKQGKVDYHKMSVEIQNIYNKYALFFNQDSFKDSK